MNKILELESMSNINNNLIVKRNNEIGINTIVNKQPALMNPEIRKHESRRVIEPAREKDTIKIFTLNANGISGKWYEINTLFARYQPDIICIQETKRTNKKGNIRILGCETIWVVADKEKMKNGLLIAYKSNPSNSISQEKTSDYHITIKIKVNGREIGLTSVYMPQVNPEKAEVMKTMKDILKSNRDNIILGDWNTTKDETMTHMEKEGINAYTSRFKKSNGNQKCEWSRIQ